MSPSWTDERRDTWVSRSRGAFAYEVLADKPVSIWMRTVRPALVVRCDANVLDVFVFTDSAAKIESDTLDHTVTMRSMTAKKRRRDGPTPIPTTHSSPLRAGLRPSSRRRHEYCGLDSRHTTRSR